jgi:nitroreductase
MDIRTAIDSRRAIRDFKDTWVDPEVIRRVLELAVRAPSGGNLQPWHFHIVSGESMTRLKALMRERVSAAPTGEETEYDIYPKGLPSPYKDRRQEIGELLYGQLKIPREDKLGRALWFARNFEFFGAPIGLFCSVDRLMGPPQWADLGMILQNVMLLLRAEGLDSCPQECWAIYPKTMGTFLCLPPERMLFAGMAIGYANADNPVNQLRTPRATFDEIASTMI